MEWEENVQRNHKDTVFHDLFSEKENALSLYNALNGTDYKDVENLQVVTLSDVIYVQWKNDVSVLFENRLELWEHQSTINYNMPLRGLIYYAHNIDGIIRSQDVTLYGTKRIMLPTPGYYVFYNGLEAAPARQDLKLSDAFQIPVEGYEWTAHVLNVNAKENEGLLKKCLVLEGYVTLVRYVQENQAAKMRMFDALDKAVQRCINENVLKEYLLKKRSEVMLMLLTEFNQELYERTIRGEGREEGRKEGEKEGEKKGENRLRNLVLSLMKEGKMDDMKHALQDNNFRNQLYQRYNL